MIYYVYAKDGDTAYALRAVFNGSYLYAKTITDMQDMIEHGDVIHGYADGAVNCVYGEDFFDTKIIEWGLLNDFPIVFLAKNGLSYGCKVMGYDLQETRKGYAAIIPDFVTDLVMGVNLAQLPADCVVTEFCIPSCIHRICALSSFEVRQYGIGNPHFRLKRLVIPETVHSIWSYGFAVTSVLQGAKSQRQVLGDVIFEGCMTDLRAGVFSNCVIKSFTFPQELETLEEKVFRESKLPSSMMIPQSVRQIKFNVFENAIGLKSLTVQSTELKTDSNAFAAAPFEQLYFPDSVETAAWELGEALCVNCKKLQSVRWSKGLIKAPLSVFENCCKLAVVENSESITTFEPRCFMGTKALEHFRFSNEIKKIDDNAFANSGLHEVSLVFAKGNDGIGDGAFLNCKKLQKATIQGGSVAIWTDAFSGSGLQDLQLLEGVFYIAGGAFSATKLTKVRLPRSLDTIKNTAFDANVEFEVYAGSYAEIWCRSTGRTYTVVSD